MKRTLTSLTIVFLAWNVTGPRTAWPLDPPHNTVNAISCSNCHISHHAPGMAITTAQGNANLCMTCHGPASGKPFADTDQAYPGQSGNSHRWDSGASGHAKASIGNTSTGKVQSGGAFTGSYAKTYTITISTQGDVGVARFSWTATAPGGGSGTNVLTGSNVSLDQGITVTFTDGASSPSFKLNDVWRVNVRTDINQPTTAALAARISSGKIMCSTCHDEHSQANTPFDPAAPVYGGAGTGNGRHCQRIASDTDQMCKDCHSARNVTSSSQGSHPVGVGSATLACLTCGHSVHPMYTPGSQTPLGPNHEIECQSCHQPHYSPATDGTLRRVTDSNAICTNCHRLADTTSPAAHFDLASGVLWPGGQYGSLFPQITDTGKRGYCTNCHQPHGWPDDATPAIDYPKLMVERFDRFDDRTDPDDAEDLCYTCHDADGPANKNVKDDFVKTTRHPLKDSEQAAGRSVECRDCHNAHQARAGAHVYTATATAARSQVSLPITKVSGVEVDYTGLGNFVAPPSGNYAAIAADTGATYEYQICFKCHAGYAWLPGAPPNGLSPNGTVATPVETDQAQEFSPNNKSGHPIVTGLDNYPNSTAVGTPAKKGLQAAAMKAPWNVNVGTQTLMCSDCHNTDAATPAAQGPHGSAAQFMLRGANAANWADVTLSNYSTSWCANCHTNSTNVHTEENHSGRRCYECHIVIPHGGKLSRLMADNDTMPERYAYDNTLSTNRIQGFNKKGSGSYSTSDCRAQCASEHTSQNPSENW
jgi:predicted CXXCH cytochrome family protein